LALVIPVMSGYSATFVDVNRNEKFKLCKEEGTFGS
jgi:hypothetical protein